MYVSSLRTFVFPKLTERDGEQKNNILTPRRIKSFSTLLSQSLPSNILGTGSSTLLFTPDSKKLLLSTSFGSNIVVVDLENELSMEVLRTGGGMKKGGREMKGLKVNGKVNGNGKAHEESEESDDEEEDEDEDDGEMEEVESKRATVVTSGVSSDGKWFAVADLERRVEVFDLSTLSVRFLPSSFFLPNSGLISPLHLTAVHHSPYSFSRPRLSHFPTYHIYFH